MGIGLEIGWQGAAYEQSAIVAELAPFFETSPVIGRTIGDLVEPGVFLSPAGIAQIRYDYRVGDVLQPESYVLAPGDDGQLISGVAVVTDTDGNAEMFNLPPRTITFAAPMFTGPLAPQNLIQGSGIRTYDIAPRISGSAIAVSLVSPPPGISVAGTVISIDTNVTGILADQMVTVRIATSGGSATAGLQVNVAASVTVPQAFAAANWALAAVPAGRALLVTVSALPDNGGSAISGVDYRIDGGAWTGTGLTAPGSFQITGLTDGQPVDVELRAANSIGPGSASDLKEGLPQDTLAPVITAPSIDPVAATISLATSEGGLLLWSRTMAATYVDGAAMEAAMATSIDSGTITVTAGGGQYPLSLAPNAAGQGYLHLAQKDAAGNHSAVRSTLVNFPEITP